MFRLVTANKALTPGNRLVNPLVIEGLVGWKFIPVNLLRVLGANRNLINVLVILWALRPLIPVLIIVTGPLTETPILGIMQGNVLFPRVVRTILPLQPTSILFRF